MQHNLLKILITRQCPEIIIVVVRSLSHILLFATPWTCSTPGFPVLHYLPEFGQTHIL